MIPRFVNASLLEIRAEGHCSFSRRSICAARTIRKYLEAAETPATNVSMGQWLRCDADETPWFPYGDDKSVVSGKGNKDQFVLSAPEWLGKTPSVVVVGERGSGSSELPS